MKDDADSVNEKTGAGISGGELEALIGRITRLENALKSGTAVTTNVPKSEKAVKATPKQELIQLDPNGYIPLNQWQEILERINAVAPAIGAFLTNSMASVEGNTFKVVVSSDFLMKRFKASNDKSVLKQIVNEYFGKDFDFMLYSSQSVDIEDKENPINELLKRAKTAEIEVEIKK